MYYSVKLLMLFYDSFYDLTFQRKCPRGTFSLIQMISCDLHFLFTRYKTLLNCFPHVKTGNWSNEDKVWKSLPKHCWMQSSLQTEQQVSNALMTLSEPLRYCSLTSHTDATLYLFQWVYTSSKVSSEQSQAWTYSLYDVLK